MNHNNQNQFNSDIHYLRSLTNDKLSFKEVQLIIFNPSLLNDTPVNNYPQLTKQEKTSLLNELDN